MTGRFAAKAIISLGVDCRVRFQASRYFDKQRQGPPSTEKEESDPDRNGSVVQRHLLDWNITYLDDVIRLLEKGCESLFDRDRLIPGREPDVVIDGIYHLRYFHLFHARPGQTFAAMLDEQYDTVAEKIRYLREKLQAHLRSSCPTLYVRAEAEGDGAERFCAMMQDRYPQHPFRLLVIRMADETKGVAHRGADYDVYEMCRNVRKPIDKAWSGDDLEWDDMFRTVFESLYKLTASSRADSAEPGTGAEPDIGAEQQQTPDPAPADPKPRFSVAEMRQASSVGLIGACVSRDMREALFPSTRAHYLWRIGTISLMSPSPGPIAVKSPSQDAAAQMTVDRDVNKTFDLDRLLVEKFVLLDFFRDMYGVLRLQDGRMITNGIEIQQYGAAALGLDAAETIEATDRRYIHLWMDAMKRFAERVNASDTLFLIVPVFQLAAFWDERRFSVVESWSPRQIVIRNLILGHMQRIALTLLRNAVLVPILPETLRLDPAHEYGPGPYHYDMSAFRRAAEIMAHTPEFVLTSGTVAGRQASIVAEELKAWQSIDEASHFGRAAAKENAMTELTQGIELVLPLRLHNDGRGSDAQRARYGLIESINRYCDPAFVSNLTIIVPDSELADARALVAACVLPATLLPESALLPVDRIGSIPRRGWFVQQLLKLAFSRLCKTKHYVTLDADVFFLNPVDAAVLRDGRAPAKQEPTAAHEGWWKASAAVLEHRISAIDYAPDNAFGVTPAFLCTDIVRDLLDRLTQIAAAKGEGGWVDYLCKRTSMQNDCWTEYSLYWTHLVNTKNPEDVQYPSDVYFYTHYSGSIAQLAADPVQRQKYLFGILQSSYVDAEEFTAVVSNALGNSGQA